MPTCPLHYEVGQRILIRDDSGWTGWKIDRRNVNGWRLDPIIEGDTRTYTDEQIHALRLENRWKACSEGASKVHDERLDLFEQTFEKRRVDHRRFAERLEIYLQEVDRLRASASMTQAAACEEAAITIWDRHHLQWEKQARDDHIVHARTDSGRRSTHVVDTLAATVIEIPRHEPSTIEHWYRIWKTSGRKRNVLLPKFEDRGRHPQKAEELKTLMHHHIKTVYLKKRRPRLSRVYEDFEKETKAKWPAETLKPEELAKYRATYTTFHNYLTNTWKPYEICKKREGGHTARQRYDFWGTSERPEFPMEEVEIDHCLLDIFVVNKHGKVLGLPWFTAMIDRRTRMITGCHLTLNSPSYASLQRCIAHAIWPKELRGKNLKNPWPCEGIPEIIKCDNAKEFDSPSLAFIHERLGTKIVPTGPYQPWLKGSIESFFKTMGIAVFDLEEGKAFSDKMKRGNYPSRKRANRTLNELQDLILGWIVDDYHNHKHSAPDMNGKSPLQTWQELVEYPEYEGCIEPVDSADDIIRLIGFRADKQITDQGITIHGRHYKSDELQNLNRTLRPAGRGKEKKKVETRIDSFDAEYIWVLDPNLNDWIKVYCETPQIAKGVSQRRAKVSFDRARQIAGNGEPTARQIAVALDQVDDEAVEKGGLTAERHFGDGSPFTPTPQSKRYQRDADQRDAASASIDLTQAPAIRQNVASPADVQKAFAEARSRTKTLVKN